MSPTPGWKPPSGLMEETRRVDLDRAWGEREREAVLLRNSGFRAVAVNLRFYALEIRIKALICRHLELENLPRACKTHDLSDLLIFTGRFQDPDDPTLNQIKKSWDLLAGFSKKRLNDVRYLPDELSDDEDQELNAALDDPNTGVISWLFGHP